LRFNLCLQGLAAKHRNQTARLGGQSPTDNAYRSFGYFAVMTNTYRTSWQEPDIDSNLFVAISVAKRSGHGLVRANCTLDFQVMEEPERLTLSGICLRNHPELLKPEKGSAAGDSPRTRKGTDSTAREVRKASAIVQQPIKDFGLGRNLRT